MDEPSLLLETFGARKAPAANFTQASHKTRYSQFSRLIRGGGLSAAFDVVIPENQGRDALQNITRLSAHPLLIMFHRDQGVSMAKRSARQKARELQYHEPANVHPLFPPDRGWNPHDHNRDVDARDRKYVKNVRAMSPIQQRLMDAINERSVVVALGPAGTGKTYLAIAKAVEALEAGRASRIVLSRPAVEAGESLGFLPGALEDKLAPYLRPLYDALTERMGTKRLKTLVAEGT